MAKTNTTKNATVKAIISYLDFMRKNEQLSDYERNIYLEQYKMVSSNMRVGVYGHKEMKQRFSRDPRLADGNGATKVTHLHNWEYDSIGQLVKTFEFTDIVVKRVKTNLVKFFGNQALKEIECFEKYYDTELIDYVCPILKYFTSKSDKVTEMSETMLNNVVIISQKAVFIGDIEDACNKAEHLNYINNLIGTDAFTREKELVAMAKKFNIHDVIGHDGNSGVVYDYNKKCYKAVFVDYGL